MIVSPVPRVAHIASDVAGSTGWLIVVVGMVAFVVVLMLEHGYVKHGRANLRSAGKALATLLALALTAVVAPTPGFAQSSSAPTGLPDLISDPPYIWFNKNVHRDDGTTIRVMSFDGYIHNIGTGALRVAGNPQIEDGMKQQVFDGNEWTDVGSPTIKFETDDGHNHFHLMRAVDYVLWDEGRSAPVIDASKVGFCLVDTEQIEEGYDAEYMIDDFNYCGVDEPDATDITMGITPGWRDTYASNVTLQWVDTSDVRPGRYWVGAVTDPNNEIVESNEDNNGLVFSMNKWPVDGYVARNLAIDSLDSPITLKAIAHGIVGARAFVIVDGPEHGTLDIPSGVDFMGSEVRYRPAPGFQGSDTFTYYAHDTSSGFPITPVIATVEIDASASSTPAPAPMLDNGNEIVFDGPTDLALHKPASIYGRVDQSADDVSWYGSDLPPGMTVDPGTGIISGVPTIAGNFDSTIYAVNAGSLASTPIEFTVAYESVPELQPINDFATTQTRTLAMYLGTGKPGSSYEGTGMPLGTSVTTNLPILGGTPEEIGVFDIVINEITDGAISASIQFSWTVKPSIRPAFPL